MLKSVPYLTCSHLVGNLVDLNMFLGIYPHSHPQQALTFGEFL
jgi:hypothetical protein